jgi:D-alanine-D-alanine ligase
MALKVCVLQPDYSTTSVDYKNYDPPRNLSSLLKDCQVDHVLLNKLTTFKQLKKLSTEGYDIFVNLCEGYADWEVPGIDVIYTLETLNLPFTGPSSKIYDPPKDLLKYVAYCENVLSPAYVVVHQLEELNHLPPELQYPLFVKPAHAGDSLGIAEDSFVKDHDSLLKKCRQLLEEFNSVLIEEYIEGREFTVLVAANPDLETCSVFRPVEYLFPEGKSFKTYSLKTSDLHPGANVPCDDLDLDKQLREASEKIFKTAGGVGYGRLDFRVKPDGAIYFLEINFTCSVFYSDGYEGSADFILQFDGIGKEGFLRHIIQEGIVRHARQQKPYNRKGNAIAGYGIYANKELQPGDIIYKGEGRSQRIITKRFVDNNWNEAQQLTFRRYAYPLSEEVFVLWDEDPNEWAPQNHSCDPNTEFNGLNVVAVKHILQGEELTLDYAQFLDPSMEPFQCKCGANNCRGKISGVANNTLTARESSLRKRG